MRNFRFFLFALAVVLLAASPAAASERTVNLGDVSVSIEVDNPHFGDPIRPGELVTMEEKPIDHDTVKTEDHCSEWWLIRKFQDCPDKDDRGHYLLPCKCWCTAEGDCELNRSKPSLRYSENMSGSACKGAEITNNCGEKITSGLPGDELPEDPGLDFEPVSSSFSRVPLGR